MNKDEILKQIKKELAVVLETTPDEIDEDENFMHLGISSIQALKVINTMRRKLDVEISPVALFEYKTLSDFAEYLANGGESDDEDEDE